MESIDPNFLDEPNHVDDDGKSSYWPYMRDPETFARQWALPGTPGMEHRVGGLEHQDESGNVSYDPLNHERMIQLRQAKVEAIAKDIPLIEVNDPDGPGGADVLLVSWGSTYSAVMAGVKRVRARGMKAAMVHLAYLNPFPSNLGEVLSHYRNIMVPEINSGQLCTMLRAVYLVDAAPLSKVQGLPFKTAEIEAAIMDVIDND
jgi:2-oxoglutarate ferredoxin oxidoreductase subunit alpha